MGINSSFILSINSNTLTDGDFGICNDKFWNVEFTDEPSKLWELGKILGVSCCREENAVIEEIERIEDRDAEVKKKDEEGNEGGY